MDIFLQISLIVAFAAAISAIARFFKQPIIIAYILTGLLIGPHFLGFIYEPEVLQEFSQFGIALLLFIVGLSLSPNVVKELGRISVIAGFGQVTITTIIGYLIGMILGYSMVESFYIAIALTFSSTIIILKLLSDKGDLERLYAKISMGVLLVQDLVAFIILIFISVASTEGGVSQAFLALSIKGILVTAILVLMVKFVLFRLSTFFAKSQEFLFLFSLAWGMGLASLFRYLGFSIEMGALIAGVTLAMFPYNYEISSKMRPLRDFFLVLFFISLGAQISFDTISNYIPHIIIFSAFVLILNPLIMTALLGRLGYSRRVSFLSGLTASQISEFSLILVGMGIRVGALRPEVFSVVTVVGIITITFSSYLITYAEKIYPRIKNYLKVFEKKKRKPEISGFANYDVILFGYNRVGFDFVDTFKKLGLRFLVVDFNPEVIQLLKNNDIDCKYGDAEDSDFLEELHLSGIKLAVSTIPDIEINMALVAKIDAVNKAAITMMVAHTIDNAQKLYAEGVDYVIMPHLLGAKYASDLVYRYGLDNQKFEDEKISHLKHLERRLTEGSYHP